MSGILSSYTVMQRAEWSGRTFHAAQDRRSGQVVHLIATKGTDPLEPYQHPALPHAKPLAAEGDTLWLVGGVSEGETLEDLRNGSHLSESDLVSALLTVLDGLASLAKLPGAPVPSYVDPACVRRDPLGRWKLDYLALAHAPEARMPATEPYGVHPFGILLYWLVTGQTVRRSRVPLSRVEHGISAALQFVLIRALGRSYPSLAELRTDIERAGQEHEFRPILHRPLARTGGGNLVPHPVRLQSAQPSASTAAVLAPPPPHQTEELLTHIPVIPMNHPQRTQSLVQPSHQPMPSPAKRLPELEHHRVTLGGGPQIPIDDRPWALPPRPPGGYRKYVVPPPPNPAVVRAIRLSSLSLVSLATVFLTGAVMLKAGIISPDLLPGLWRNTTPVVRMPGPGQPGSQLPPEPAGPVYGPTLPGPFPPSEPGAPGPEQPGEPEPPAPEQPEEPIEAGPPDVGIDPPPPPVTNPPPANTPPPVKNPPTPPKTNPIPPIQPPKQPVPTPPANQPEPPQTKRPEPEPGTSDYADASQGGLPTVVYFNGRDLGWAYIIPHPASPYITINTFNRLFGQNVYWIPLEGGSIRLMNGAQSVITKDYTLVRDRLWLKLTPFLQEALGVRVAAYNEKGMYFAQ